jgi:hypothetical protein
MPLFRKIRNADKCTACTRAVKAISGLANVGSQLSVVQRDVTAEAKAQALKKFSNALPKSCMNNN